METQFNAHFHGKTKECPETLLLTRGLPRDNRILNFDGMRETHHVPGSFGIL